MARICERDAMSIQAIHRSEFKRLLPPSSFLENMMVEQIEWFSDKSGHLLGAIAKGEGVADWNYVILKRASRGEYRIRKVMRNFFGPSAARVDLLLSMARMAKLASADRVLTDSQIPRMPAEAAESDPDVA